MFFFSLVFLHTALLWLFACEKHLTNKLSDLFINLLTNKIWTKDKYNQYIRLS